MGAKELAEEQQMIMLHYKYLSYMIDEQIEFMEQKGFKFRRNALGVINLRLWNYEARMKQCMRGGGNGKSDKTDEINLDRHKFASCLCAAAMESQVIIGRADDKSKGYANEIMAFDMGIEYLYHAMLEEIADDHGLGYEQKIAFKSDAIKNYGLVYPDGHRCDEGDYRKNIIHDLRNTYERCIHKGAVCHHFDLFAYSRIYYHLEECNRNALEQICQRYV